MKPYYEDDAVCIYHGDCRVILPTLTADVLIADPPYGTNAYPTDTDVLTGPMFADWCSRFDSVAVFGWPERLVGLCVAAGVVPDEWITWWPTNARYRGFNLHGLWRETECIAAFGYGAWSELRQAKAITTTPMQDRDKRIAPNARADVRQGDVWREDSPQLNPNQRGRLHTNQKSETTIRKLLAAFTAGVVIDPCAGSGTTLAAARSMGRKAIGIEIEERYCEIAARRMDQTVIDFGEVA